MTEDDVLFSFTAPSYAKMIVLQAADIAQGPAQPSAFPVQAQTGRVYRKTAAPRQQPVQQRIRRYVYAEEP